MEKEIIKMVKFEDFAQSFGFVSYPFSVFTAEEEKEFLDRAFIQPLAYSTASAAAKERKNVFIYGERGTGKTALLYKLMSECNSKVISISDYSQLPLVPSQTQILGFYISNIAPIVLKSIASSVVLRTRLNRDDKLLLSYLLKNHTTSVTRDAVLQDMKEIQHSFLKRVSVGLWNGLLGLVNNATGAAVDAASDAISKSLGLPSIDSGNPEKEYFKKIQLNIDDTFDESKANQIILGKLLDLCKKVDIANLTLVLDRVDEDSRWKNDAELVADFLRPFLVENEIFFQPGLRFIFSIWSIPYQKVKSDFRINKFCVEQVEWTAVELMSVLNKRMSEHSAERVGSYQDIVADSEHFESKVVPLANSNPRDLWQLMNKIFREQYRMDSGARKISVDAMDKGVKEFVRTFNYYEYYPRKINAKSNSMDVYSYIAHLSKLTEVRFTSTNLDDAARTGGSTQNYIVGMEAIGLVRRCEEKGPKGANLYEIRDPKVQFAVMHNIDIRRDA
ncbi:P-loop ATPase, Sll1717 family [Massilia sp. ZL223]|uniref:P-loop ATPase, Sll1717 family n=1 Tax=Massilia sp. ZL223 TaxID=2824904 RepID=UPI001B81F212|nr:hypothetical protein [Massilia sp. ZL223]MBQ5962927.1 hypothetical protein [Massilia sp. ZL223]